MIPTIDVLSEEITETTYFSRTYKIKFGDGGIDTIAGFTDDLDAVKQAIYLILNTERYQYVIYSWDYGVELLDLYGKPMPYVMSELPRRIKEALVQDDRIEDVVDFEFERNRAKLHVTFTVVTSVGTVSTEMEVDV
jgi:hypothetical protein